MPSSSTPIAPAGDHEPKSYGQVVEYIENRLFLASYTHPPNENTPFPYPSKSQSPSKRSSKLQRSSALSNTPRPVYFSVDRSLLYNAFHADFGPLHIGHLYRFAVQLHEVLGDPENDGKVVVFWSHADSRSRANAACILACYMVLIQSWPPHLALAPITQIDPPLMPFRDAGYSQADFILNIQDVVYGVWRAKEEGLCVLKDFNLEEYEKYERVDKGDFNWITQHFVAFASPQHSPTATVPQNSPEYATLPRSTAAVMGSDLPDPFKNVLAHFRQKRVGLVVRLNNELYSPSYFSALGMTHLDMIFEDGTCPALNTVKRFIRLAHEMITTKNRGIAVHCKAGLGRTGCLIGAYLIYRHGFTANEVIAYMRFMRPGMVVGPQQHWLHLNQNTFRQWWFEDSMRDKLALLKQQATPPRASPNYGRHRVASNGQTATPPPNHISSQKRRALGELSNNEQDTSMSSTGGINSSMMMDENLPAPTPGQPRKTSKLYGERHNPYTDTENAARSGTTGQPQPDSEIISLERHLPQQGESESDEEYQLRLMAKRSSRSPNGSHKKRAVSCVTTSTSTEWPNDIEMEKTPITNHISTQQRSGGRNLSGSGAGALSVGKRNSGGHANGSPVRKGSGTGVRKTSGRVGSAGVVGGGLRVKQ